MQLLEALNQNLYEIPKSKRLLIEDEGLRWKFNYPNYKVDPTPDILVLGSYTNQNTGNNLIGGINLHYLNDQQISNLQRAMPEIMGAQNLYGRYWVGRRLIPDIFKYYYRTYNANKVNIISKDKIYPKYGKLKTIKNWVRNKLSDLVGKKETPVPEYPDDISDINQKIDQRIAKTPEPETQPETDHLPQDVETQMADNAFQKYKKEKSNKPIEPYEQDIDPPAAKPEALNQIADKTKPNTQLAKAKRQTQLQKRKAQQDIINKQQELAQAGFERDQKETKDELEDIENDDEIIEYYSPILKKYITESNYGIRRRTNQTTKSSRKTRPIRPGSNKKMDASNKPLGSIHTITNTKNTNQQNQAIKKKIARNNI